MHGTEHCIQNYRASCLSTPRPPDLPVAGSKLPRAPRTHSEQDCPLTAAFRSPATTSAHADPATRSMFPACCFASESIGSSARSVFRSTAKIPVCSGFGCFTASDPLQNHRQTLPTALPASAPLRDCYLPSGSMLPLASPPASPPSEAARLPLAPRRHILSLGLATDHRSRPATAS